jgi:hypothetical protein
MRRRSTAGRDCLPEYAEPPTRLRTRREQLRDVGLSPLLAAVPGHTAGHDDERFYGAVSVVLSFWAIATPANVSTTPQNVP